MPAGTSSRLQVVVLGTSVGGSSVIMAAAEDPTIDGVIAENPVACVGI
jgi:cephalosporin-C deacetylase-like acetyl esterase